MRSPTQQRSFRLSARTAELLDATAAITGESRNALADRLLGEALRLESHPLVRYRTGASGRRQAQLVGTRLKAHQIISTLRASAGDIDAAAEYLSVDPSLVRAALAYYADFPDEIDEDAEAAERFAAQERARWERQQRALG